MHNWPLLPGCLLEEVENTCVDLRLWRLGIRQRPWLLSLEDRWWCGSPSDLVWLCGWDEGQESWKTTASVFRPTSCEQHTVVGAACCHGNALRITEASFSILNIWIWTIIMFREALIMNINVSHMMFLNIFDSSEIFMCKRWKLTFQFHPHPAVMEVLEQLTQPKTAVFMNGWCAQTQWGQSGLNLVSQRGNDSLVELWVGVSLLNSNRRKATPVISTQLSSQESQLLLRP